MKIRIKVRGDGTPTGVRISADGERENLDTPLIMAVGQTLFRKIAEWSDEVNRKPE